MATDITTPHYDVAEDNRATSVVDKIYALLGGTDGSTHLSVVDKIYEQLSGMGDSASVDMLGSISGAVQTLSASVAQLQAAADAATLKIQQAQQTADSTATSLSGYATTTALTGAIAGLDATYVSETELAAALVSRCQGPDLSGYVTSAQLAAATSSCSASVTPEQMAAAISAATAGLATTQQVTDAIAASQPSTVQAVISDPALTTTVITAAQDAAAAVASGKVLDTSKGQVIESRSVHLTSGTSGWKATTDGGIIVSHYSTLASSAKLTVNGVEQWSASGLAILSTSTSGTIPVKANDVVKTSGMNGGLLGSNTDTVTFYPYKA
jgi:outer membrane murein-binding lipoprotein Lpp